jgi:hypothetical protein
MFYIGKKLSLQFKNHLDSRTQVVNVGLYQGCQMTCIFKPNITILVNFGDVDIFYGRLVYFTAIWYVLYILWFRYFFRFLCWTKKNLAILVLYVGGPLSIHGESTVSTITEKDGKLDSF